MGACRHGRNRVLHLAAARLPLAARRHRLRRTPDLRARRQTGRLNFDLTKEQVESFPPYKEGDLESEERWGDYETRYRAKWESHPVMHRAETDRNITPTTQQLQGNQSSMRAEGNPGARPVGTNVGTNVDPSARSAAAGSAASTGRVVPAGTDSMVIDNSAVGIGGRWDTFQARLRERRKEAVVGCSTCTIGPAGTKGSESADTLKKAI